MGYFKKKFRNIKKFPTWIYWLPAHLLELAIHTIYRLEIIDPNDHIGCAQGSVSVTWHNRLLFFPVAIPKFARKRTMAVVSASRDGQYIADFISILGLKSLRGSSSRGGTKAQLAAVHAIREGYNVSFTPDGPRGPIYVMKKGPVQLASLTGAGVIPITINASSYWSVRSWDRFQLPKPFCKLTLILGDKIFVPPDLDEAGIEEYRQKIESALLAMTVDQASNDKKH